MFSEQFKIAMMVEVFRDGYAGSLHDVVFEVIGKSWTDAQLKGFFISLPEDIQCDALKWGLSDTEVREEIYEFLEKKVKDNE